MSITDLNTLVTILLALSMATERFITFCKNLVPWLVDQPGRSIVKARAKTDEWARRLVVQLLSVVVAWGVAGFLGASAGWDPFGRMAFDDRGVHMIPIFIVGLLASSGSALWSSVLGLTSAAKDLRKQTVIDQDGVQPHTFDHG